MVSSLQKDTPAHLHHLQIVSPERPRLISFYRELMDLQPVESNDDRAVHLLQETIMRNKSWTNLPVACLVAEIHRALMIRR